MRAGAAMPPQFTGICLLLVGGAISKSAQFPFHSWLPDTMETPTPVSALMHAGIINAGGFLVVRLSPLISLSPIALDTLVVVGAITATFASLVMMTQASIKRMLAFSTIAQMGFMMLQCGLGAFSIAVLHIMAHSLYKAHAFLSSGSVVELSKSSWVPAGRTNAHPGVLMASLFTAVGLTVVGALAWGISPLAEPGAIALGAVLVMALAHLLWSLWGQSFSPRVILAGLLSGVGISLAYFALHIGFKKLLAPALPHVALAPSGGNVVLLVAVVALFGAVLLLQSQLPLWASHPWCRTLYVHARNGFYFNTLANRAVQMLWPAR
jgi:NAD(P)H-quinone oxidoreductase subunit 5